MNGRTLLVLDPGHGGETAVGASSPNRGIGPNGLREKTVALELARRTRDRLLSDHTVVLTREDDRNLSLTDRASAARNLSADVFVSIHLSGATDPTVDRTDVVVARAANAASSTLATELQQRLAVVTGATGGVLQADLGQLAADRHDPRTAACLVEVADITNPGQAMRLATTTYLDQLADAIAAGIRAAGHMAPAPAQMSTATLPGRGLEADVGTDPDSIEGYEEESQVLVSAQSTTVCTDDFCPVNTAESVGTEHFSLSEFQCHDGTAVPPRFWGNVQTLMQQLEVLRTDLGGNGVTIISGYRTPEYNSQLEGAASRSRHMCGQAADIRVANHTPLEVRDAIERLIAAGSMRQGGLGIYDSFVHYDVRGARARWDRRRSTGQSQSVRSRPQWIGAAGYRPPYARAAAYVTPDVDYQALSLADANRIWQDWLSRYAQWSKGVPDASLSSFPHAAICQLKLFNSGGGHVYGTGFYIGNETLLTCGHNFLLRSRNWETTRVEVQPAYSPTTALFATATYDVNAQDVVHPRWWSDQDATCDLAVLRVPGLPAQRGTFSLANQSLGAEDGIVVCGYGKVGAFDTFDAQGQRMDGSRISRATLEMAYYPIQTIGGHSGSPVFHGEMVVAVHTGGHDEQSNQGVLLNPDKIAWIQGRATGSAQSLQSSPLAWRPVAALTDSNSPQSEQSREVRLRVARSVGLAEGRFDSVHDDSNRVNFGIGSWTGARIATVLDSYEQLATANGTTATLHGYFGGQAAFEALRQRFRDQGVAATASTAERAALRALGADTSLQDAQVRQLAEDVQADLDAIGSVGNPWYPFIDGGMGAISELAAHVLVHARHQAGGLQAVLRDAIAHFGGDGTLGQAMVDGRVTERDFLTEVSEQIVRRVQARYQTGVRNRYTNLFTTYGGSDLSFYFNPAN